MFLAVRKWKATGIFCNAAVVGEPRNCFYVRESRAAQGQPLGLEDARTGLAQGSGGRNILQHSRLRQYQRIKLKRGGRFPASPWSLEELRRFNRTRRTRIDPPLFGRSF